MTLRLVDKGINNQVDLTGKLVGEEFNITIEGNNNYIKLGKHVSSHNNHFDKPRINIAGDGNVVQLDPDVSLKNEAFIRMIGNDNRVFFANNCSGGFRVDIQTSDAQLELGEYTTAVGMFCAMHEPQTIRLGKDCMFSAGVLVTASDMHSMIDLDTGKRINPGADIIIGDHVWLGFQCLILKGVQIGSGSVVGAAAVVTRDVPENCVVAGNPAKIIRENVTWKRSLLESSFSATTNINF